jgi:predicted deacylase
MTAKEFYNILFKKIKDRRDIKIEKYKLRYKNGVYEFLKIISRGIKPKDKIILIRAGIHGEEIAGPLTILNYINRIIDYTHKRNIKVIIYPLGNPSGFEIGTRYSIDNVLSKSSDVNNDFLRYELKDGKIVDDIQGGNKFKNWHWSSDKKLGLKLTLENELMHCLLKKDPLAQVVAVIDLHQDYITENVGPAAYYYSYGNLAAYKKIVEKIKKIVPILKNKYISAGEPSPMKSDENGFIVRHDGSLTDLFHRLGAKYSVTVETTGVTPIKKACRVNLVWIFGLIDLIA